MAFHSYNLLQSDNIEFVEVMSKNTITTKLVILETNSF